MKTDRADNQIRENLAGFALSNRNDQEIRCIIDLPNEQLFLIIHPPGHHGGSCKMENHESEFRSRDDDT